MFVRGGFILPSGYLNKAGSTGNYWSPISLSSYAYRLCFDSLRVYPSDNDSYRYYGQSVRCVALGG